MAQKTKITVELIAKRGISIMPTMLQEKNERKRKYLEPKKYDEFKKKEDARDREHRLKKKMSEQLQVCTAMSTSEETLTASS